MEECTSVRFTSLLFYPRRKSPDPGPSLDIVEYRKISYPDRESNPTVQSVACPTELSRIFKFFR
jgi:hypothetical protein